MYMAGHKCDNVLAHEGGGADQTGAGVPGPASLSYDGQIAGQSACCLWT
eukprot:SAG31_NODE_5509_length_2491_cov_1.987040_2_plen_49_part_00